jgi:hypothetical protein
LDFFVFSVYDPDPISSLRKRRISADSVDSGSASGREMHPHTAHDLSRLAVTSTSTSSQQNVVPVTPTKAAATSDGESSSPIKRSKKCRLEKSAKKHKKKHKHHHCKHKHKKHKSSSDHGGDDEEDDLRIKLDGSFNNTTTYSIRSPIYHARSEESNHDEEGDDESSDDDGFSDDELVTTVKAVSCFCFNKFYVSILSYTPPLAIFVNYFSGETFQVWSFSLSLFGNLESAVCTQEINYLKTIIFVYSSDQLEN